VVAEKQQILIEVQPSTSPPKRARAELVAAVKKKHGIATHHASHMERPIRWVAVQVPPKRLDDGEPIAGMSVPEMFAWFGRLLDEGGWVGYGPTEYEAVAECCRERKISFTA
jgi:hypothetical protein